MKKNTLYYFNPTCEMAVANGSPYYQPPALLTEFEQALAPILACFSKPGDLLLKEKPISNDLQENLQRLGCEQPKIARKEELLEHIEKNELRIDLAPWGWSPACGNQLSGFLPFSDQKVSDNPSHFKNFYERQNGIDLLQKIVTKNNDQLLLSPPLLPEKITHVDDVEKAILKWKQVILKIPLSSSGRGLLVIRKQSLNNSNRQWIETVLKQQHYLVAEPLLDKVLDFSFQYESDGNGNISYNGISYFKTNSNGQYQGHYLNTPPDFRSIKTTLNVQNKLAELASQLLEELGKSRYSEQAGFIGIDALIYKDGQQLKIQPCVEINPRNNMGNLSLRLQQLIHPESTGYYQIYNRRKKPFPEFVSDMKKENPPIIKDGKFASGFLNLTDCSDSQQFGAYLILNNDE